MAANPLTAWTDVAIIGAGAVGHALARRLAQRGYAVAAVLSRRAAPAAELAQTVGAPVGSDSLADLPADVSLVVLCVPDDAITPVARQLATLERPWSATAVAHTSGARPAGALAPLAEQGAATFSLHPMQTITRTSAPAVFEGIYIGLEGDADAVHRATRLVQALGAHAITIPTDAKPRYHLAGVLASNGLVALMGLVSEVLASAGIDPDVSPDLLGPLVQNTWANVAARTPDEALTGPAVRGDEGTITAHLDTLAAHLPHLMPAYAALTTEMVRLAVRGGRLPPHDAEALLDTLHSALHRNDSGDAP